MECQLQSPEKLLRACRWHWDYALSLWCHVNEFFHSSLDNMTQMKGQFTALKHTTCFQTGPQFLEMALFVFSPLDLFCLLSFSKIQTNEPIFLSSSEWRCHPLSSHVTSSAPLSMHLRPTSINEFGRHFSLKDSWEQTFSLIPILPSISRPGGDERSWPRSNAKKEVSEDIVGEIINKNIIDQENWRGMINRVIFSWTKRACVKP